VAASGKEGGENIHRVRRKEKLFIQAFDNSGGGREGESGRHLMIKILSMEFVMLGPYGDKCCDASKD
jgi:hypothetical protein